MDTKIGTSAFPNRSMNVREKSSNVNSTDPLAMKKEFGDKNLSQVLNEVADPNYAASKRKVNGHGKAELDKDAFFKLMLAQLKQQDPTNPLKSHEMAAQLAQFSSVEQLANVNETLKKMSANDGEQSKFDVLALMGKQVSGDSGMIDRVKGDKEHKIEFTIPQASEKAVVTIKDEKGVPVKKYELTNLKEGKNQVVWNGLHDDGKDARVGLYTAEIAATSQGRKIQATTEFMGAVDGVQFTPKGAVLMVDGKTLNLKEVRKIETAQPKPIMNQSALTDPMAPKSKGAMEVNPDIANLDTVQMDKELRQQIDREAN